MIKVTAFNVTKVLSYAFFNRIKFPHWGNDAYQTSREWEVLYKSVDSKAEEVKCKTRTFSFLCMFGVNLLW